MPSINIITHKQIVRLWDLPTDLEQLHQVVELSVDITTHNHRGSYRDNVGLLCQNLSSLHDGGDTLSQRALTSASGSGLHASTSAICLSKSL